MARFYVTHENLYNHPPSSRSGCYCIWSEGRREPIGEFPWVPIAETALVDAGGTRSERQARQEAYSIMRSLGDPIQATEVYRQCK